VKEQLVQAANVLERVEVEIDKLKDESDVADYEAEDYYVEKGDTAARILTDVIR